MPASPPSAARPQPAGPPEPLLRGGRPGRFGLQLALAFGAERDGPARPGGPASQPAVGAAAAAAPTAPSEAAATAATAAVPAAATAAAPPGAPAADATPETLHPALWRASQLGGARAAVFPSGFAVLDAALPGGGWPARALTELLLPHPGVGELRLLAPALAALQARGRWVLGFDPPAEPDAWALEALGLRTRLLVWVRAPAWPGLRLPPRSKGKAGAPAPPPAADLLWALEQTLGSGQAGAVLAWLPARLPADALRRLQLAAQAHDGPAFLLRAAEAGATASVAPLRLALGSAGPDALGVHLLKRRGPPLAQPLTLALAPVLAPSVRERGLHRRPDRPAAGGDGPARPEGRGGKGPHGEHARHIRHIQDIQDIQDIQEAP